MICTAYVAGSSVRASESLSLAKRGWGATVLKTSQALKAALTAFALACSAEQPQTCLNYETPVTLQGKLVPTDEYGYWQWTGLLLECGS